MAAGRRRRTGGERTGRSRRRGGTPGASARAGAAAVALLALALSLAAVVAFAGAASGATVAAPPYLLALGGSASVGFQPTAAHPRGQPTDDGYAEDLVPLEQRRWPGLTVVHLGCPGATTVTMLDGGGHCHYPEGTQLSAAQAFLRSHPTTVLVTVDLGFNDLLPCLRHELLNPVCVDAALATVHDQLGPILAAIEQAAPAGALVVGIGHYDPYLGDYVEGAAGQAFAAASLGVMERLDATLHSDYRSAGVAMADVAAAFDLTDRNQVAWSGTGTVPSDVARTCALTWMCDPPPLGHNPHPDEDGYRTIAAAIAEAVADPSGAVVGGTDDAG